ncbi:MAG TPA: type II toxin-antitoxin system RelE/ParE family toxin [Mycobacterium sp.]|nr:type II toxin-antitoxin system RelE/ParE family toxin [Mycobacterium sp.]HTX94701.1 type II toxin-antitoxin system RelE/ParE family toxin [Mycobacterium sp.]
MRPSVVLTPEAEDQLAELYRYIGAAGSVEVTARYTEAIVAYCKELAAFPHRGRARDDIRSGLRTIGFRRRVVIAFAVLDRGGRLLQGSPAAPDPRQTRRRSWCGYGRWLILEQARA